MTQRQDPAMSTSRASVPPFHVTIHDCARMGARRAVAQAFITAQHVYRGRCAWCGATLETSADGTADTTVPDAESATPAIPTDVAELVSVLDNVIRHYDGLIGAEVARSRELMERHRASLGEAIKRARKLVKT